MMMRPWSRYQAEANTGASAWRTQASIVWVGQSWPSAHTFGVIHKNGGADPSARSASSSL